MKKELILAVIIGLLVGLVITYGVYRVRTATRSSKINPLLTGLNQTQPDASNSTLVISSPEDESVQTSNKVTVAGTTLTNSTVVVFINDTETITSADTSGNFSTSGTLQAGSNIIIVHSLTEDGSLTTAERTVIYLTDSLTSVSATASASPTPTASPRATVRPTATPVAR